MQRSNENLCLQPCHIWLLKKKLCNASQHVLTLFTTSMAHTCSESLCKAFLIGFLVKSSNINCNAIFKSLMVFGLFVACGVSPYLNKNSFCYVTFGNTFLDHQNQWGGLTKIDITFDPFDIFWWNLAVIRRNELPLGLLNFILKFLFLVEIF